MLLPLPPQIRCGSPAHYPHPPQEPVQHATARVPRSRDNFPRRTHGMPQAAAMSPRPLLSQAHPAFQLWLPYTSCSPAWESKRALISHCFKPLLSGRGKDTRGHPTHRGGAEMKAEIQELCKKLRERGISLGSLRSSGLNPHNQHDKTCICGIRKYQTTNVPKIEEADFGSNCILGVCFLWLISFWF